MGYEPRVSEKRPGPSLERVGVSRQSVRDLSRSVLGNDFLKRSLLVWGPASQPASQPANLAGAHVRVRMGTGRESVGDDL